jgi:hypothetical protein
MARVFKVDGQIVDVKPQGAKFSGEELTAMLGGLPQWLYIADIDRAMLINQDGKILGLPRNQNATIYLGGTRFEGEEIVGDAILVSRSEAD